LRGSVPATSILGIGTARARHLVDQASLARRYEALLASATGDRRLARRARLLFSRARLQSRQFAIPDVDAAGAAVLYQREELPTTSERMEVFGRVAPDLAEEACRLALSDAGVDPRDVSSLVIATCTGVGAPDLDVELVERLRLPPAVERNLLVWMSCTGSFPALRVGRRAVEAKPGTVSLVVCVELCSLHVRADAETGSLVAHSLFADGASAVVLGEAAPRDALATLGAGATRLVPEGRDVLRWEFSDHGFRAHLGPDLPVLVAKATPSFVEDLIGSRLGDVRSWCVHPGGPAILDAVEQVLRLDPRALEISREVLRTLGNMSSATIWYVLERALADLGAGELGVLLGFGTGLTLEGLVFERGGRTR
jgi:predicted naringenin-chalcone synthase